MQCRRLHFTNLVIRNGERRLEAVHDEIRFHTFGLDANDILARALSACQRHEQVVFEQGMSDCSGLQTLVKECATNAVTQM